MKIDVHPLDIDGPLLITPKRYADDRGFLSETYNIDEFAQAGVDSIFVQDNHAMSVARGTVRGLHFQAPPHAQDKLIRVVRGRIFDVIVDIRKGSPTYGQHASVELSAENCCELFVPGGFAHGYCSLEPASEVLYKTSAVWSPEAEGGIRWNDPDLNIAWPAFAGSCVSAKDGALAVFADFVSPFTI